MVGFLACVNGEVTQLQAENRRLREKIGDVEVEKERLLEEVARVARDNLRLRREVGLANARDERATEKAGRRALGDWSQVDLPGSVDSRWAWKCVGLGSLRCARPSGEVRSSCFSTAERSPALAVQHARRLKHISGCFAAIAMWNLVGVMFEVYWRSWKGLAAQAAGANERSRSRPAT